MNTINYTGSDETVKVVRGYNASFELFEYGQTSPNWENLNIFGPLVSFILPPNSIFDITFESNLRAWSNNKTFPTELYDIITVPSFNEWDYDGGSPMNMLSNFYVCSNGRAEFNITIIYANLSSYTYLNISKDGSLITQLNQTISNQSWTLVGHSVSIQLVIENELWLKKRFLIHFAGYYIGDEVNTKEPDSNLAKKSYYWIIGLGCGFIVIFLVAIGIIGYCIFKKKQKRYEQLFDLLKEMQISADDIMTFKEKSDQMFIKPEKILINYENILGQGSCSTVYKGHITGPSPLFMATKLIETQKLCDCDVAVKVARNFGPGEVELLYKEIQAMKTIGFHENIMCMLGWAMPGETPCLVFDIAKMALLQFVRGFREVNKEDVPFKDFVSKSRRNLPRNLFSMYFHKSGQNKSC
uniref:Serine-threonine/tyrosine-protein kinase catalytic domain-containing protein n=1 Tax=Acrobeloides nanus TaxID=290746 RepID=A0A914EJW1_9BILA